MPKAPGRPQIASELQPMDPGSVEHDRKSEEEVDTLSPSNVPPKVGPRAYLRRRQLHDDEEAGVSNIRAQRLLQVRMEPSGNSHTPTLQSNNTNDERIRAFKDEFTRRFFDRIAANTPCIFLCIGPPERSQVVQVGFKDDVDHADIFREMRRAWDKSRARLPFRKVTRVEEVRFRFSGVESCQGTDVLMGTYELLNPEQLRRELDEEVKVINESITVWQSRDEFSFCREDYISGKWEHAPECPSLHFSFRDCDVEDFDGLQYRLRSLSLLPMLTLAFQSPVLANGQRLLDGLAQGPGIYPAGDMLRTLFWHNPRIGDIAFNGYKITEEWDLRHSGVIPLAATLTVGSCFVFRVAFGDWQTAIGASALGIAVLALIVQWMVYIAGKD